MAFYLTHRGSIHSQGPNKQYSKTGLDKGLATIRRQAIVWTNDGLANWRIWVSYMCVIHPPMG